MTLGYREMFRGFVVSCVCVVAPLDRSIIMCRTLSGLVNCQGLVKWRPDLTDHHSHLFKIFGLQEERSLGLPLKWARFEFVPSEDTDESWLNPESWVLDLDEKRTPDWWPGVKDKLNAWLIRAVSSMILTEGTYDVIEGCYILGGSAVLREFRFGKILRMTGSSQVVGLSGSSQVGDMYGSSQVRNMYGSSQVRGMYGSSQVRGMSGSSQVGDMYGSSQVGSMYGSSQVRGMYGSSQVGSMYDSSQVRGMYDSSQVRGMYGSSQVGSMYDSSQVGSMYDSSRVVNRY